METDKEQESYDRGVLTGLATGVLLTAAIGLGVHYGPGDTFDNARKFQTADRLLDCIEKVQTRY